MSLGGKRADGDVPRILISYRRDDSSAYAGRLYDGLAEHFGDQQVFMDITTLQPGVDFVAEIERAVAASDAVLVVIGRDWLMATDAQGRRRLDKAEDFVRLEVEAALSRKARVIPVLVGGASMPTSDDLPEALRDLARHNAIELSDGRWRFDLSRLIAALDSGAGRRRLPKLMPVELAPLVIVACAWALGAGLAEALYFIPRVSVGGLNIAVGWVIGGLVATTTMVFAIAARQWWLAVLAILMASAVVAACDALVYPLRHVGGNPNLREALASGGTLGAALSATAGALVVLAVSRWRAQKALPMVVIAVLGGAIGFTVQWQVGWGPLVWAAGVVALVVTQGVVQLRARGPMPAVAPSAS